ncbi:MAG: universal stress protein [Candidatus Competibacterales bacterium]
MTDAQLPAPKALSFHGGREGPSPGLNQHPGLGIARDPRPPTLYHREDTAVLPTFKTILYPTDLEPHANELLRFAASLANHHGAKLIMLHIVEPLTDNQVIVLNDLVPAGFPDPKALRAQRLAKLQEQMTERAEDLYRNEVPDEHHGPLEVVVLEGSPVNSILQESQKRAVDLIVMGHHEHSALGELLFSVAHGVVHRAPCPVLLVPQSKG